MQSLLGQVAVVTGAAQGIGFGIASVLAEAGAEIYLLDRNCEGAAAAAESLRPAGAKVTAIPADVTSQEDVTRAVQEIIGSCGRIDICVSNAALLGPRVLVEDLGTDEFRRMIEVNLIGAYRVLREVLPPMRRAGYGRLVVISSITGPVTGFPGFAHYGASKAALVGMVRNLAVELAADGVTVNAVLPGNIATEGAAAAEGDSGYFDAMTALIPAGRLGQARDIAYAVRYLASPEASYVTGQSLVVDGGATIPEGLLETRTPHPQQTAR
jgi:3-oxoacyl-[acyl-carrier protein] reductase